MKSGHRLPSCRICIAAFLLLTACAADAQKDAPPPSAPKEIAAVPAAEVERINQSIGDVDLLRPLLPLNLTQPQVDALVKAMKEIAAEWREVKKLDDAALKSLSPDVDKVHADILTGAPIPKEFDAKIVEAQKASADRYSSARLSAMRRLLTLLSGSLSDTQKDSVEAWSEQQFGGKRIPKKYQVNPSKAPKDEVQGLAIAALIERCLLLDRTLTLLQQYKPGTTAAAPTSPPAKQP